MLAKSVTPSRIDENNKLLKLDDEDMAVLESIYKERGPKRFDYPSHIWFSGGKADILGLGL